MNTAEFKEIRGEYLREQRRWKSLSPGQIVFDVVGRGIDHDYFRVIISKVNVEERYIIGNDYSQNGKEVKLHGFSTIPELVKQGVKMDWIDIIHENNDIILPDMHYVKLKYKRRYLKVVDAVVACSGSGLWKKYPKFLHGINGRTCDYSGEVLMPNDKIFCIMVTDKKQFKPGL